MFYVVVYVFRDVLRGQINEDKAKHHQHKNGVDFCFGRDLFNLDKLKKLLVQSASRILVRHRYLLSKRGEGGVYLVS